MSHSTLQDALHRALIADPPAQDGTAGCPTCAADQEELKGSGWHELPTTLLTECRSCYGTNPCCPCCHGAGWWRG